jgi:hypothetical protein
MMIRRLHRMLVDWIADSQWLRGRAGTDARWAHYERHARAWNRARERHAAAHSAAHARAERMSRPRPPRVLAKSQQAIGERLGAAGQGKKAGGRDR